jgi:hypothetical protein
LINGGIFGFYINQSTMKKVYLLVSFGLALNLAAQKGKKNTPPPPPPPAPAGQCPVMHGAATPPTGEMLQRIQMATPTEIGGQIS